MQITRRFIQITVIFLIVAIPLVNYYGIKIHQRDDFAIEQSKTLSVIHSFFEGESRESAIEKTHAVKGSVWTMDIFGFKITDPLAAVESTALTFFLYLPLLLSIAIPVLFTLVFGKVYCGWICPMNFFLDINDKLRSLLKKTGYNTREVKFSRNTKFYVIAFGIVAAFIAGRPLLALIYPPAIISRIAFYKVYNGIWGSGVFILGIIFFVELILSRRWWCRYICPGGAVYTMLSKFRMLRIKLDRSTCDNCGDCVPICPYDLKPMTKTLDADCDQCGVCISVCKPDALTYTFSIKDKRDSIIETKAVKRKDKEQLADGVEG